MFDMDAVKIRLESFQYKASDADDAALAFCIDKVSRTVKTETNQPEVPEGLEGVAVDMAVGEFLLAKKTFAPADLAGFNLAPAIKQIQAGDTNTVFAVGKESMTDEQRLNAIINYLLTYGIPQFSAYRKLRW